VALGDPDRVRQIMVNLLDSAVKFTESGSIQVRVTQEHRHQDRADIQIAVSDTGIGISQDKLAQIFDAFTQADGSSTRRFGGTGLGLAICRQLVQLMGGKIWVESELCKGSTFYVRLPFGLAESNTLSTQASAEDDTTPPFNLDELRTYVDNDNDLLREIAHIFFNDAPQKLEAIAQAIQSQDATALKKSAHALKGSVSTFGAKRARQAAQQLETLGHNLSFDGTREIFLILESAIAELKTALQTLLEKKAPL